MCASCAPQSNPTNRLRETPGEIHGRSHPAATEPGATTPNVQAVVNANTQFAVNLYARLRRSSTGNLFFSPASLSTSLAMTWAGAKGETAEQMARVLQFPLPQEKLHRAFAVLRANWAAPGEKAKYQLSVANRIWGQVGFDFVPKFLAVARDHYGAEPAQVDFVGQGERARWRINDWVEHETQGKIRDLIAPGMLDSLTRLVLTNATYFKGEWSEPFPKNATQVAPFHLSGREQTDVSLMDQKGEFRYWAGDGLNALKLPYRNVDLAMVVLLPDAVEKLPDLEAKLSAPNLSRWLSELRTREVQVYLPRFELTSQFALAEALKAMGTTRVFGPAEADLSGMSREKGLYLSTVIHKAVVEVNEEGTEAAAATETDFKKSEPPFSADPVIFRADHPFVFLIRDERTGSVLFLGRLVNPAG